MKSWDRPESVYGGWAPVCGHTDTKQFGVLRAFKDRQPGLVIKIEIIMFLLTNVFYCFFVNKMAATANFHSKKGIVYFFFHPLPLRLLYSDQMQPAAAVRPTIFCLPPSIVKLGDVGREVVSCKKSSEPSQCMHNNYQFSTIGSLHSKLQYNISDISVPALKL